MQPRWLSAAIWQIAREAEVSRGEIEFVCGPAAFPVVWHGVNANASHPLALFQINLHYRSDQMLFSKEGPVNPGRFGLLAAHELIRRFKGQIHSSLKPPGRQEISVLIPLMPRYLLTHVQRPLNGCDILLFLCVFVTLLLDTSGDG